MVTLGPGRGRGWGGSLLSVFSEAEFHQQGDILELMHTLLGQSWLWSPTIFFCHILHCIQLCGDLCLMYLIIIACVPMPCASPHGMAAMLDVLHQLLPQLSTYLLDLVQGSGERSNDWGRSAQKQDSLPSLNKHECDVPLHYYCTFSNTRPMEKLRPFWRKRCINIYSWPLNGQQRSKACFCSCPFAVKTYPISHIASSQFQHELAHISFNPVHWFSGLSWSVLLVFDFLFIWRNEFGLLFCIFWTSGYGIAVYLLPVCTLWTCFCVLCSITVPNPCRKKNIYCRSIWWSDSFIEFSLFSHGNLQDKYRDLQLKWSCFILCLCVYIYLYNINI